MALSQSVEESLQEAEASLRNALSFAARQERPMICSAISEILTKIHMIKTTDTFIDTLENMKKSGGGDSNDFFKVFF